MSMQAMVEETIKFLVMEPEAVSVAETQDRGTTVFVVTVSPNDVGRVIGKDGRVISCIRQVIGAAGAKSKIRTMVKVVTD